MSESIDPFSDFELEGKRSQLLGSLLEESERGVIIIGSEILDGSLLELVTKILPENSASYVHRLTKFPGPISSFASRTELAYAFRLIPKSIYKSLCEIRSIRNKAAHLDVAFKLVDYKQKLLDAFKIENFEYLIKNQSLKALTNYKMNIVKTHLDDDQITDEMRNEIFEQSMDKIITSIEHDSPKWHFVFGVINMLAILKLYERKISFKGDELLIN